MTLEEAIQHCKEKADGSCACADDHRQLAEWLTELLERRKTEQRWIPCDETVEIPDYKVLACDKYGGMIIGYLVYDKQWICESETELMYEPLAWMSLPELYKEDNK